MSVMAILRQQLQNPFRICRKMRRRLLWAETQTFSGWVCDSCRFALANPKILPDPFKRFDPEDMEKSVIESFDKHVCANYPLTKQRTPDDFLRANVRVVKDSTEG